MLRRLFSIVAAVLAATAWLGYWLQSPILLNPALASGTASPAVVIDAVYYDGYEKNDADEAVALRNMGNDAIDLGGWTIEDGESTTAVIPNGTMLPSGDTIWITKDGDAFLRQFGFQANLLASSWPRLANGGDEVILSNDRGARIDVVVYGDGDPGTIGWTGPPVQPYSAGGLFGKEGQILYRKRSQTTGLPTVDTDSARDWAQTLDDPLDGRRVRYPAWNLDRFQFPLRVTGSAALTVSIAPDNSLESVVSLIDRADSSVLISSLTIENIAIGEALASAARRGVSVKLLLEGSPVGGITPQEKFICRRIEAAGGQCWFMIRDDQQRVHDRYRYLHAKYILVDQQQVAISSENFSPDSMPADDKSDGTWGRRGVILITDAPQIVTRVEDIFSEDLDPAHHVDLFRWHTDDPQYGAPPDGFVPLAAGGGITYTVRYPQALTFHDSNSFELQHSPENSLRNVDGYLHLLDHAGVGDSIYVQQLQERFHWGPTNSDEIRDPSPRVERYLAAARRGAKVRLLLDRFFEDPDSEIGNAATCRFVNRVAHTEGLDLVCTLANPTGLGIHNKMILAQVDGRGYVHIGSLNGTELSSKGNRELMLLVQSDGAYDLLKDMFERDTPHVAYAPLMPSGYRGPAHHLLISEVLYDPSGPDEVEFVELVNPTSTPLPIGGYSLSDAVSPEEYEDLRRFPAGTTIGAGRTLVVATSGLQFWHSYGFWPDFEILETSAQVANLVDDPAWGESSTFFRLGNLGDEVILRDTDNVIVDALSYGAGELPGQASCSLLPAPDHSWERFPYWRDSDNCPADFRAWPFPSPGSLPIGSD